MGLIRKIFSTRKYSFLLFQLVKRDFKIKYRGSVLGVLWSVLNPLLNMIVLSIVFSRVFRAVDNYKMYLLSGLTIFNYFNEATNMGLNAIVQNFGLITKVYFPKFILPVSKVFSSAINLLITTIVFLVLGLFMEVTPWIGYVWIPYILLCLMVFAMGVSFIVATLQVFFRDTQHLYGVLLTIWMYATPILYPLTSDVIPESIIPLFKINPLYIFIDFLRQITLYQQIPEFSAFVYSALWAVSVFILGSVIFVKSQKNFIYYT